MNKLSKIFSIRRILILLFLVLTLFALFKLYERHFVYYLTAKFSESGPLYKDMQVFYKGYRIGRISKIYPSKDYKYTFVKIILYPHNPKLSKDIIAKAKHHNVRKDYIDLILPEEASTTLLKNGSIIDGEPAFDLEAFLSDIADSGLITPLIQTFSDTLVSLNKTSTEIGNFFSDSRLILKDNRGNINQTTHDLAQTSKSLKKMTMRFNNSITEDKLNNTTSSVEKSSTNILAASESVKNITAKLDCATKNIDKTVAKVDCTISEINKVATNVKVITGGLCEVLGKRFAGMRILFGKPMDNKKCPKCCPK